ncbi:effector-associated constant component EACC1 [Streptomyces pseudogriseolus]|uniref:effector-associated constant component EACC1 n=1 Tax=Streptomyces pseudogriseolus TaxID=36817 RepID=UPI003FA30404
MIIRDGGTGPEDAGAFVLRSPDRRVSFSLRLPAELADGFREYLRERGFDIPEGDARGVLSEVVVATAGNPAAWTAVGGTVVAFLRRHRGKVHRFEVDGRSVSVEGYSAADAERLAADLVDRARTGDRTPDRTEPGDGTPG